MISSLQTLHMVADQNPGPKMFLMEHMYLYYIYIYIHIGFLRDLIYDGILWGDFKRGTLRYM